MENLPEKAIKAELGFTGQSIKHWGLGQVTNDKPEE